MSNQSTTRVTSGVGRTVCSQFGVTIRVAGAIALALVLLPAGADAGFIVADPAADWVASDGSTAESVVGGTAAGWSYWRAGSLDGTRIELEQKIQTGDVGGPGFGAGSPQTAGGRILPAVLGDNMGGDGTYRLFSNGDDNSPVVDTDLLIHPDDANSGRPAGSEFIFVTYTLSSDDLLYGPLATIAGSFRNLVTAGNGVNVYVLHNTTTLWSATPTGNTLIEAAGTFNIVGRHVAVGDTISFVVDSLGDRSGDETALRGSISLVPEPGAWLLLLSALASGLLVRRRRGKE